MPNLVSVIILTYNQEKWIKQTLDSVMNQKVTFKYEVIIGEDCGDDNTRSICEEYSKQYDNVVLLEKTKNQGIVGNWINCISHCKGKYIMGCAGDDYWHNPNKMQFQVDYMEKHPNCGILHTDYDLLNVNTNKIKYSYNNSNRIKIEEGFCQQQLFEGKLKINAGTVCLRKELFDKYIPIQKYMELNFPIEDWPTWIILSKYTEINYIPLSTVTYRYGHESISNTSNYEKITERFKREKIMYEYLCSLFPNDLHYNEKRYDSYINHILLNAAFKNNDYLKAKEFGKLCEEKSQKVIVSKNKLLFHLYCFLKKMKESYN